MKGALQFLLEVTKVVVVALIIVVPLRALVFQPFLVRGDSMEPTYHNGDYLIVDQLSYRFRSPERGEVIVLKFPFDPSQRFIKRIIGLPGETVQVQNGQVLITTAARQEPMVLNESSYLPASINTPGSIEMSLKENEYFVMGDNRPFSSDSRKWGVLPQRFIVGKVFLNVFFLGEFAEDFAIEQ